MKSWPWQVGGGLFKVGKSWQGAKKGSILSKDCLTSVVNSPLNIPTLVIWQDLSESTLNKWPGKNKIKGALVQIGKSRYMF